jgi:uncharacterized membrane protein YpjA
MSLTHYMTMSMTYKSMSLNRGMNVLNFTRDVNDIPMTCHWYVIGDVIGYVIGDAPD